MKAKTRKLSLENFGDFLKREKGCLVVRNLKGKKEKFPLLDNEIGQIEIRSGNLVSVGALVSCCYWNINVLVLTSRGHPVGILRPLLDSSYVLTRLKQYDAYRNRRRRATIAKTILLAKLRSQDMLLRKWGLRRFDPKAIERVKNLKITDSRIIQKLNTVEGHFAERYFGEVFSLYGEDVRPSRRRGYKAYDAINNLHNLTYTHLIWRVHLALVKSHLEPYLGFLHRIAFGRPSLMLDFLELYRATMDNFVLNQARSLTFRDFVVKDEAVSKTRKGKRQYVSDKFQREYTKRLDDYFKSKVEIPRIMRGKRQELQTLINEEALLFAKFLRKEREIWNPRIVALNTSN